MRKSKTITVRVTPELYRQTRHLAAQYDTTVTEIVADLLEHLARVLERLNYPVGIPRRSQDPAASSRIAPLTPPTPLTPLSAAPSPRYPEKPKNPAVPLSSTSTRSTSITFTRTSGRRTAAVPLSTPHKSHNLNRLRSICKIPTTAVYWFLRCFSKLAVTRKISA
jgi:hypothetical protein